MCRTITQAKCVSWIMIPVMLWSYEWSLVDAASHRLPGATVRQDTQAQGVAPHSELGALRFDALLSELKAVIKQAQDTSTAKARAQYVQQLLHLRNSLAEEHGKVQAYFSRLETFLQQQGLPAEIQERQAAVVRDYHAKYALLMALLEDLEAAQQAKEPTGFWQKLIHRWAILTGKAMRADWQETLGKAATFLEEHTPRPKKRHFDPYNLPRRSLRPPEQPLLPKLTPEEWRQAFPNESRGTGSVPGKGSEATTEAPTTLFASVPSPLTFVPIDFGRIPGSGSVT